MGDMVLHSSGSVVSSRQVKIAFSTPTRLFDSPSPQMAVSDRGSDGLASSPLTRALTRQNGTRRERQGRRDGDRPAPSHRSVYDPREYHNARIQGRTSDLRRRLRERSRRDRSPDYGSGTVDGPRPRAVSYLASFVTPRCYNRPDSGGASRPSPRGSQDSSGWIVRYSPLSIVTLDLL